MVVRISDKTQNYSKVTKLLIKPNKMDVLPYFDFDVDKCKKNILYRNSNAKIFEVCAKTGEGIEDWCNWLENEVKAWKE